MIDLYEQQMQNFNVHEFKARDMNIESTFLTLAALLVYCKAGGCIMQQQKC